MEPAERFETIASIYGRDGKLMAQDRIRDEVMRQQKDIKPPVRTRWPVGAVVEIFYKCRGVWSDICYALDCTSAQLATWLEQYPAKKDDLVRAKVGIIEQAEEAMAGLLRSKSEKIRLDAAKTILTKLGKDLGWSGQQSITNVQVNVDAADKTAQIKAVFGIPDPAPAALPGAERSPTVACFEPDPCLDAPDALSGNI